MKTPNDMFDVMTNLYEGKNINMKMTLGTQLKDVKMQISKSIQSYFLRIYQIKKQPLAIGDNVEEEKVEITTLNGLPSSWESFIQVICFIRKLTNRGLHIIRSSTYGKKRKYG